MRKGYITSERQARQADRPGGALKPLWEWPELDVLEIQRRARKRWHKASRVVTIAAQAHRRAIGNSSELLDSINRAAQQRYARSAFGFDALLLRLPYFRQTPPKQWDPQV